MFLERERERNNQVKGERERHGWTIGLGTSILISNMVLFYFDLNKEREN